MAGRIRSIKPELLDDEVGAALSDTAWRLWIASWCLADDHGNLRAHARYLAASVWQDTSVDVQAAVDELVSSRRWEPYAVEGQRYVHIRNWEKHQRIDNAGKPRVPSPTSNDGTWNQSVSAVFAETRGDSRRFAANTSGSAARPTTTDLRSPTIERDPPRGAATDKPKRRPESNCPPSEATGEFVAEWARSHAIDPTDSEFAKFLDWHRATGTRRRDWAAAWRNWKRNAKAWAKPGTVVQSAENRAWKMPEGFE